MTPEQDSLRAQIEEVFVLPGDDWVDDFISQLDVVDGGTPADLSDEQICALLDRLDPPVPPPVVLLRFLGS